MQSSRLERRMNASNEDVGCIAWELDRMGFEEGARDSLIGRSVKLVYMPSERWNSIQFGGRGCRKLSSYTNNQHRPYTPSSKFQAVIPFSQQIATNGDVLATQLAGGSLETLLSVPNT